MNNICYYIRSACRHLNDTKAIAQGQRKKNKATDVSVQNSSGTVQEKHLFNRVQQHPVVHVVL